MIKLNKQQIDALSNKIIDELKKEVLKENKKMREIAYKDFLKTPLGKAYKLVSESKINDYLQKIEATETIYSTQLDRYLGLKINTLNISKHDIRNDIILATIECEDLDSLINQIKQKYAK